MASAGNVVGDGVGNGFSRFFALHRTGRIRFSGFGSGFFSGGRFFSSHFRSGFFDHFGFGCRSGGSCGGGFFGVSQLLRLFFGAFLGLFARDGLVRVVARGAFLDTGGVEEAGDAVARLGADAQPMLRAIGVELDTLGIVLGEQRVVAADTFDEAAIARAARVSDDDLVIGTLFRTAASEANSSSHDIFLCL